MTNFKITNITNTASKRDMKFNTTLSIDYVDSMMKKSVKIKPGETVFLQIHSLPLSVHKLRVKKLVSVVEIGDKELKNSMPANKPVAILPVPETSEETELRVSLAGKKKAGRKPHETETVETQ
jgi:hypothetical protein